MAQGLKFYFTGKVCKHGHLSKRLVRKKQCYECVLIDNKKRSRKRYAEKRDEILHKQKLHYQDNVQKYVDRAAEWRRKNPHKQKQYVDNWFSRNPGKRAVYSASYRASKINAQPEWCDQDDMRIIYKQCRKKTKETGVPHEVDHIIPLQSDIVCGLHVPWNLQIITQDENRKKSNRMEY